MVKFILKRIGTMIIAMFMIILITFTLMHSIPGGPFTNTKGVPEEVTQAMEAKYGLDQPMPVQFVKYLGSLGTMCNDASANLRTSPHELLIPALMICVIMFAFNFVGDGLRDALDPKLKK